MKFFIVIDFVLICLTLCLADDCGTNALNKAIELHEDLKALYNRACHDLKISSDSYLILRKKCVQDMIESFDNANFKELVIKFYKSSCTKRAQIETCTKREYTKYRHCIFDYVTDHLQDVFSIYRNQTQRIQTYNFLVRAKDCFKSGLDEIESRGQTSD